MNHKTKKRIFYLIIGIIVIPAAIGAGLTWHDSSNSSAIDLKMIDREILQLKQDEQNAFENCYAQNAVKERQECIIEATKITRKLAQKRRDKIDYVHRTKEQKHNN